MIPFLVLVLLFVAELFYFRLADRFNIIDKPNLRSSHTRITLRGGGVIFPISVLCWFCMYGFDYPFFILGLLLISLISFADDVKPLSSKLRLPVHFAAMMLMFYQWQLFEMPWYYFLISLIFCTGVINAYNFMDGINGITGGYSTAVILSLMYINNYVTYFTDNNLLIAVLSGLIVFNLFNFRKKAKCFAGDVGAVSIAFIIVFLLGMLIIRTEKLTYLLLLAMYGVDSILTIVHRLMLKENIFEPHRKHAYQLLANELKFSHLSVSGFYAVMQLIISCGLLAVDSYRVLYFWAIIVFLVLSYILFKKKYFYLHLQK